MIRTTLLSTVVAIFLTCFTSPLIADIQSDFSDSFDDQFTPDHDVRYLARDTVARKNPNPNSEPVLRLKADKRIYVISKKGQWAEVQPASNSLTGFVPLSSLSRSPVEASSSAPAEDK